MVKKTNHSKYLTKRDRACVAIELNLKMLFHMANLYDNGPIPFDITPIWWKNRMDVKYGKDNNKGKGSQHKRNKNASIKKV